MSRSRVVLFSLLLLLSTGTQAYVWEPAPSFPDPGVTRAVLAGVHKDGMLLAMGGKVSSDLQTIIRARPQLLAELLRQLKEAPDDAILRVVREVRDGDW